MMVLNDICEECNKVCNSIHFRRNFNNWTSGNNDIDKFIQNTQISAHDDGIKRALEWIPYNRLCNIKYIAEYNNFGKMCRANWTDGCILYWNDEYKIWDRKDKNMVVFLKISNNPASMIISEFINKV
jgi:hypothetical protein